MRVLVAGAGISGLAAARGLSAAGHEVVVLERAPAPRLGGGAITLWPNGTAILSDLGLRLAGTGRRLETLSVRTAGGRRVVEVDLVAVAARLGSEARVVPRGSLITALADGLPDGALRFGARVAQVRSDRGGVRVRTSGGAEYEGDLLVGADGAGSRVRAAVLGGAPAAATGLATWQGLTPAPFDPGAATTLLVGPHGDCGFMGAGGGLLQWLFDVPWPLGALPAGGPLEMLRRRFAGWADPVPRILASLREDDLRRVYPHTVHRVPRRFGAGRCVLLGDAAHAMPPVMGHGANQSLEDVAALVESLDTAPGPAAVRMYSARRRRRAAAASAVASRSLVVSGPRTLLQGERVLGLAGLLPSRASGRAATWGFGRLLSGLSARI